MTGGWVGGTGRVIASGRIYTSTGGAPRYGTEPQSAAADDITVQPEVTEMGQEVEHVFAISESVPVGGDVRHYEMSIDGEIAWSGLGEDRVQALVSAIVTALGADEEPPSN